MRRAMRRAMQWSVVGALWGAPLAVTASDHAVGKDCVFKGHKLWGKVQFVDAFPDLKVQLVDAFPDLKVKYVDAFPDGCGKWQKTDSFPDLKVQRVDSFPDLKIQVVDSFPGVP